MYNSNTMVKRDTISNNNVLMPFPICFLFTKLTIFLYNIECPLLPKNVRSFMIELYCTVFFN